MIISSSSVFKRRELSILVNRSLLSKNGLRGTTYPTNKRTCFETKVDQEHGFYSVVSRRSENLLTVIV